MRVPHAKSRRPINAAAMVGLLLLAWGTRISGERAGWWAALIFTLSLQTFVHAKAAVADMWMVLFVTLGSWAGWEMIRAKQTLNSESFREQAAQPASARDGLRRGERSTPKAFASRQPNAQWNWWLTFYVSLALGFSA